MKEAPVTWPTCSWQLIRVGSSHTAVQTASDPTPHSQPKTGVHHPDACGQNAPATWHKGCIISVCLIFKVCHQYTGKKSSLKHVLECQIKQKYKNGASSTSILNSIQQLIVRANEILKKKPVTNTLFWQPTSTGNSVPSVMVSSSCSPATLSPNVSPELRGRDSNSICMDVHSSSIILAPTRSPSVQNTEYKLSPGIQNTEFKLSPGILSVISVYFINIDFVTIYMLGSLQPLINILKLGITDKMCGKYLGQYNG